MTSQVDRQPASQGIENSPGRRGDIQVYIVTVRTGPERDPEIYWIDACSEQRACARAIKYAGGGSGALIVEANRFRMFEEADEHPE